MIKVIGKSFLITLLTNDVMHVARQVAVGYGCLINFGSRTPVEENND